MRCLGLFILHICGSDEYICNVMKQLSVIVLVLLVLIGGMSESLRYASFKLNQAAIAEQYCVNITQPELLCSGKCYYYDLIADGDDVPSQITHTGAKIQFSFTLPFLPELPQLVSEESCSVACAYYQGMTSTDYCTRLLRPPAVAA